MWESITIMTSFQEGSDSLLFIHSDIVEMFLFQKLITKNKDKARTLEKFRIFPCSTYQNQHEQNQGHVQLETKNNPIMAHTDD